jgi:hypothetical protein
MLKSLAQIYTRWRLCQRRKVTKSSKICISEATTNLIVKIEMHFYAFVHG